MRIRRSTKRVSLLAAAAVFGAGLATLGASIAPAGASIAQAGEQPNDGSKATVAAAYMSQWAPTTNVALNPTGGSNNSCTPWATSPSVQSSTLKAINFARWMTVAEPVTFDQTLSNKAARAAQIMAANNALSHSPPSNWRCYSAAGSEAAGSSNLGLFGSYMTAGELVNLYLSDWGSGNEAAGHRRWVLYPETGAMGSGNASGASQGWDANALWVIGNYRASTNPPPNYSAWPTAGYFPRQIEPGGRWSFSTSRDDISLSGATVSVRNASGSSVPLTQHSQSVGYGLDTVVWDFNSEPAVGSGSQEVRYAVTVSGIRVGGVTQAPYSYTVRLFDPVSATPNQLSTTSKVKVSASGTTTVNVACSKACEGWAQLRSDEAGTQKSANVVHYKLNKAGWTPMYFNGVPNISANWKTRINAVDSGVVFKPLELVRTDVPQNDLKTSASTRVSPSGKATVNVACSMACEGWAQLRSDEAGTQKSANVVYYKLNKAGWGPMYFTGVPNISANWKTRINAAKPASSSGVTFKNLQLIQG